MYCKKYTFIKGKLWSRLLFFSFKVDPIEDYKKKYRENWKKIVSQINGYELNISEEEIRNKLIQNVKEENICQLIMKSSINSFLYLFSYFIIDGVVKYNCDEGQNIFKKKEFLPINKDKIIDKELVETRFIYTKKDCLSWWEEIQLSFGMSNEKNCLPFKISTVKEKLKKEIDDIKIKYSKYLKVEFKYTCSNKKV